MKTKDRIELFLKYQSKNMTFEEISNKLEIKPNTLRRSLNKNGYKIDNGIYAKSNNESQISFEEVSKVKNDKKSKNIKKKSTPKRDKKININQDDIDKLCEVYDWYIEVRDNKAFKQKTMSNKKDIILDKEQTNDFKSVSVKVEKKTWEDFERLCSNSSFNKKEILTQALKDFMKNYKNLL